MEVVNAYQEDVAFTNVANTRDNTRGYVSGSSAKVGGTHPVGPWKTLKIKQGDVVNGEVYARYQTSSTGSGINLSLYLTNPSNFRGGSESNRNPALLNLGLGLSPVTNPPAGVPKAQLRYLFYDKDNKFVSSQSVAVSAAATNSWLKLTLPQFSASQDGYLQVLVVNESNVDVWFDDLSITYTEALVVQENHYDPWGLNLAGIETQGQPDHKFQYNGKEKQQELGLNWSDFGWRNYDAQLGRWLSVDPLADKRHWLTPYNYVQNNPLLRFDPDGLTDYTMNKKTGEIKEVVYDNEEKQKANIESKTDRIVQTNKKGEIEYKKNGEARTAVSDIEKGILRDGANFQTKDNVIAVGGEGQATVGGVRDFVLKLSNYIGKEVGGYYLSEKGKDAINNIYIGRYGKNDAQNDRSPFSLYTLRPDLLGKVDVKVNFHTHLSRFGDNDRLRPSNLGSTGGDEGYKKRQLQIHPSLKFIIITNPSSADSRATEIKY